MSLPVTETANFSTLLPMQQRTELMRFNSFFPKADHRPLRKMLSRILGVTGFGKFGEREDFAALFDYICKRSKRDDEKKKGLQTLLSGRGLRAIYDFAELHDAYGVKEDFGAFVYTMWGGIKCFEDYVLIIDGEPHIVFFDLRASNHLTPSGRKFVFSIMHEHIRQRFSDLRDTKLAVIHAEKDKRKSRKVKVIRYADDGLYSLDEIQNMLMTLRNEFDFVEASRAA